MQQGCWFAWGCEYNQGFKLRKNFWPSKPGIQNALAPSHTKWQKRDLA